MTYILMYAFLLASGQTLTAEQEAHDRWRPVRTLTRCHEIAAEQELRMRQSISDGNGLIVAVKVRCERRKHKKR